MTIQLLGHSCFLITTADGKKIITDPYTPGAFQGTLDYGPITIMPDIVTVSHAHADHGNVKGLTGHFKVVNQPGDHAFEGIVIKGVQAFHDAEGGSLRGMNVIFVIEADGMRICHLGDLGAVLTPEQIREIGRVDVLLIPVGGYFTIGLDKVDEVIEQLQPKIVIPMHYRTDKIGFSIGPVDDFLKGKTNVQTPGSSELEITQLPAERTTVVLEHAL